MLQSLPVEETNLFEKCVADDQQEKDVVCNDQFEYVGAKRDNSLSCYNGEVGNSDASPERSDYDEDQDENEDEIIQNAVEMFKKYFQFSATKYKTLDLGHETDGSKPETCASSYSQDNIQSLCSEMQTRHLKTTLACDVCVDLEADSKQVNSLTISPVSSCADNSVTNTYSSTFEGETLQLASDLPAGELKRSNPGAQSLAKMCLTKTSRDDPSLNVPQFVIKSSPSPLTCVKSHELTCSSNDVIHFHSANNFDKRLDTNGIKTYASSNTNITSKRNFSNMIAKESQNKELKKKNMFERAKQSVFTCKSIKVGVHQTIPYSGSRAATKRPNSSCTTGSENFEASENKKMCRQNITRNTSDLRMNASCLLLAEIVEEHNSSQPHTAEGQVDSFVHDQSAGAYELDKHCATENFPKQYSLVQTCEESQENFSKLHSVIQAYEEIQENLMRGANQTLTQDSKKSFTAARGAKATKQCSVCEIRFTTNKSLKRHIQTNAMFKDACRCKVCSRKFHSLHKLNIHIYKFHQVSGKPKCLTCNFQCSNLRCLAQHVLKHTQDKYGDSAKLQSSAVASPASPTKGKAWKCATCGFICLNQAHIIAAHKCKDHPNKCKKCDKRFPTRSSFNLHMASHTNRVHECDLCGQHFKTKTSCHYHRLSHGTNQGGYLCQQVKIDSKDKKECPTYLCSECDKVSCPVE
ncbi:unnamed protein product [Lymnaea stagnalis]|uniref:C2H2-type domain-containing protein n=1 Tax=Lymnaea stagnalis TaxID=6523 RepID=A0AAV2GY89_LYMST